MGWINSTSSPPPQEAVVISKPDALPQIDSEAVALVLHRTRELVKDPNISLDSSVFAAGMTSLEAIQFIFLLSEVFKREVSPAVVLKHSTLREILSSLSAASAPSALLSQVTDAINSRGQESQDPFFRSVETMLERLDFDTRVLGIPTSRAIDVTTPKDLDRVLEHAISEGVHLLYLSLNAGHPLEVDAEPHRVCTKVTYTSSTADMLELLHNVSLNRDAALLVKEFASEGMISSEMIELAINTGLHSRFLKDPRLGREQMMTMFETWLRNSAKRVAADYMLVASVHKGHNEKVVGYITCKRKVGEGGTFGDIPLMACNPEYSHLGVTWHLLYSAIEWFKSEGIERVESSTHATNKACKAMFEIAGMHISRKSHDYHIWVQPSQF
jgi:ribosomal protein S18 acetylase RimI-like enzyme